MTCGHAPALHVLEDLFQSCVHVHVCPAGFAGGDEFHSTRDENTNKLARCTPLFVHVMRVCVCVCVRIVSQPCTYSRLCTCMNVYRTLMYLHECVCVCVHGVHVTHCVCVCVCVHGVRVCVCVCMCARVCVHVICMCTCARVRVHVCTCARVRVHVCTCVRVNMYMCMLRNLPLAHNCIEMFNPMRAYTCRKDRTNIAN